jgi:vacuolar protein sorting-associated protein 16
MTRSRYRYIHASPSHLVARLTSRNLHLLALRISTYLSLKPDVVLKHWASAKIMRSKASATDADPGGDEEVCKMIVDKFEQLGGEGVSYADIAKRAWEVGRAGLATKVCDLVSEQIISLAGFFRVSFWIMSQGPLTKYHCC